MKIERIQKSQNSLKNNNDNKVLLKKYKNVDQQKGSYNREQSKQPIFSSPKLKTTQMSINRMDNQIMVHPYNGIQHSKKN